MFIAKKRAEVQDKIRRRDQAILDHILTPELFLQAALRSGLEMLLCPLHLVNRVGLAISAAGNPDRGFADILGLSRNTLVDHETLPQSDLGRYLTQPHQRRRHASPHDPRKGPAEPVSEAALAKARQRMPSAFWVARFLLVVERFHRLDADVLRWPRFRLLAVAGSDLSLPDWPALREHFGTANNAGGRHGAQARLVLLPFPQARRPCADALGPIACGEIRLARQLLQGLPADALVLLDAGFWCYGLFGQIHYQGASVCLRLRRNPNLRIIKELRKDRRGNDVLVEWTPRDSRSNWRKAGLPPAMPLRLLIYPAKGLRPLRLLTNVVDSKDVPYEQFWGRRVSPQGEILSKGVYNMRWEIEITYLELKVQQQLENGLRSRCPEGTYDAVAGHVLYYLLVRWLMVEAAVAAGVSPLRLSFTAALREIKRQWPSAVVASAAWLTPQLRPRRWERLASHRVAERPRRSYRRGEKARRADKRAKDAQRTKQAKSDAQTNTEPRPWFGQGWDLAGAKSCSAAPPEG